MSNIYDKEQRRAEQVKNAKETLEAAKVSLSEATSNFEKAGGSRQLLVSKDSEEKYRLTQLNMEVSKRQREVEVAERNVSSAEVLSEEIDEILEDMDI